MNKYMQMAVEEGFKNIQSGEGGPFGAVIVRDGELVARARNKVLLTNDPTMHAEMIAIRQACAKLGRFDLSDCELYSTCQPCPMCIGAIFWARIPKLYYGALDSDADAIGFSDKAIYDAIRADFQGQDALAIETLDREDCLKLFKAWSNKQDKAMY
ncbi:MAG: nucleoside deaminase [Deltaproteobacteria bacterium]|nr:nucleoside deaminase [Deltaproteobacteria bacterium]